MTERAGVWRGQIYRPGDEDTFPVRAGGVARGRVTGVGEDGTVYVQKLSDTESEDS